MDSGIFAKLAGTTRAALLRRTNFSIASRPQYWKNDTGEEMPGETISFKPGSLHSEELNGLQNHAKYGNKGIYFLRSAYQRVVIIASRAISKEFYTKDRETHKRTNQFGLLGHLCLNVMGSALGVKFGEEWNRIHEILSKYFTSLAASRFTTDIQTEVKQWLQQQGRSFEVYQSKLHLLPLRVLSIVLYGRQLADENKEFIEKMSEEFSALVSEMNWFRYRIPILGWILAHLRSAQFMKKWNEFHRRILKANPDATEGLLFALNKEFPSHGSKLNRELLDSVTEILLLNVDVTYIAMGWLAYNMAKSPSMQCMLRDLVDQSPSLDSVYKSTLLNSFVKESARLMPSLSMTFPVHTSKNMTLGGYQVPANTVVLVDITSLNRDPKQWTKPDSFDPEMNNILEKAAEFHRFGLGSRKCLGMHFADLMVKTFICTLVQQYHISVSADHHQPELKTSKLPFFAPFTNFPRIKLEPTLPLQMLPTGALEYPGYTIGKKVAKNNGTCIVGISLGNSYFSQDRIKTLLSFCHRIFSKVYIFIPDLPAEYTFTAIGMTVEKAKKKVCKDSKALKRRCEKAIQDSNLERNAFHIIDWEKEVRAKSVFEDKRKTLEKLLTEDPKFQRLMHSTSRDVLKSKTSDPVTEEAINTALLFLLEELACLLTFHQLYNLDYSTYVYHISWPILEEILAGSFFEPSQNLGFLVVREKQIQLAA